MTKTKIRTAAATAARRRQARLRRIANAVALLLRHGYTVVEPAPPDPCGDNCPDPWAHAEGGHDV
jgi:hypothetical protein